MKFRSTLLFALPFMMFVLSGCSRVPSVSKTESSTVNTPTTTATIGATGAKLGFPTATPGVEPTSPGITHPSDWKVFTSAEYHISLDYPPNWTVEQIQAGIGLYAPQGGMILLSQAATGGLSPEEFLNQNQLPNTRCTPSTNPHGLKVVTCFDTLARTYSAYILVNPPQAGPELLSLALNQNRELQTFEAIIASLRLAES